MDALTHIPSPKGKTRAEFEEMKRVLEREGMKETHQLGMWLSLYGVPETTAASLRQGLSDVEAALSTTEK